MNGFRWFQGYCFPEKPKAATAEEWVCWTNKAKDNKFCYFLTETVPMWYRVKLMRLRDIKYWFLYRYSKEHMYHLVDTGLEYGYYDIDRRMIHANFNMLKEYVEIELAGMQKWTMDNEGTIKKKGGLDDMSPRALGLQHLKWESELTGNDTAQAAKATEVRNIYLWWVDVRPNRPDPDAIGWDEAKVIGDLKNKSVMEIFADRTDEEKEASLKRYKEQEKVSKQYYDEDTDMLCRLIKIRNGLWT